MLLDQAAHSRGGDEEEVLPQLVHHRYIRDIVAGALCDGLRVR